MAVADIYLLLINIKFVLAMLVYWLSAVYQAVDSEQLFLIMKMYLFPWHKRGR